MPSIPKKIGSVTDFRKFIGDFDGDITIDPVTRKITGINASGKTIFGTLSGEVALDKHGNVDAFVFEGSRSVKLADVGVRCSLSDGGVITSVFASTDIGTEDFKAEGSLTGSIGYSGNALFLEVAVDGKVVANYMGVKLSHGGELSERIELVSWDTVEAGDNSTNSTISGYNPDKHAGADSTPIKDTDLNQNQGSGDTSSTNTPQPDNLVTPTPQNNTSQIIPRNSTYKIQPDDTLTAISKKSGVPVDVLREHNNIDDPDKIYAGADLEIPTKDKEAEIKQRIKDEREAAIKKAQETKTAEDTATTSSENNSDPHDQKDADSADDPANEDNPTENKDEQNASGEDQDENKSAEENADAPAVDNVITGTIGSIVGSHIGMALGIDGRFETAAVSAVGQTFGRNIGEVVGGNIDAFDDFFTGNGQAGNNVYEDFATSDFGQNAVGAGVGLASSFLTSELSNLLDVGGDFGGALFETVTDFAISSVIEEGLKLADFNPMIGKDSLLGGFEGFSNPANWASMGGGFLGGYLGRQVVDIDTQAEAIGSSMGSALGAWGGAAAAVSIAKMAGMAQVCIPIPFVGALIGAFVGTIIGCFFGGLFGGSKPEPPPPPHAEAVMELNADGEFELTHMEMEHGGDGGGLGETISSMADTLNALIEASGGSILNAGDIGKVTIGYTKDEKHLNGEPIDSLSDGVDRGLLATIRSIQIEGGDPIIKRAIYNSRATTIEELLEDVQAAEKYRTYVENQDEIDQLLEAEGEIEELLQRADELAADSEVTPAELRAQANKMAEEIEFWKDVLKQVEGLRLDQEHYSDGFSKLGKLLAASGVNFSGQHLNDLSMELSHGRLTIAVNDPENPDADFSDLQPRFTISDWDNWKKDSSMLTLSDGTIVSLGGLVESFGVTENSGPVNLGEVMAERLGTDGISGTDMNDVLGGTSGDDVMSGGKGRDTLKGGAGNDTADYSSSDAGVDIDLAAGTAKGGDAAGDKLVSIENLTGSSQRDVLKGDAKANVIDSGAGDDAIASAGGDDVVLGGAGEDVINAGAGDDVIDGGADSDNIFGDGGRDRASGGAANDSVFAGADDDFASGGDGNDMLSGGSGDDVLIGGSGDDVLVGGEGSDYLVGGTGTDTAIFDGDAGDYIIKTENGRTTVRRKDGTGDEDVLKDVEFFQFDDSVVNRLDTVVASGGADEEEEEEEYKSSGSRVLPSRASMMAMAAALGIAAVMATDESSAADEFYDLTPDQVVGTSGGTVTGDDAQDVVVNAADQAADIESSLSENTATNGAAESDNVVVPSDEDSADEEQLETSSFSSVAMPELDLEQSAEAEPAEGGEVSTAEAVAEDDAEENVEVEEDGEGAEINGDSDPEPEILIAESSPSASGDEDSSIDLDLNVHLSNPGKALIIISGVPEGVSLSAGTHTGSGNWTLEYSHLEGLKLLMPNDWAADFELGLSLTQFGAYSVKSKVSSFTVQVQATTNAPTLTVVEEILAVSDTSTGELMNGTAVEDTFHAGGGDDTVYGAAGNDVIYGDSAKGLSTSPLVIDSTMVQPDADGSETLTLAVFGVPVGGYLSAGTEMPVGSGVWSLTADQIEGLEITVPAGAEDYTVAVIATTTDIDPDTGPVTASSEPKEITVKASDVAGDDELHGGAGADELRGEDGADVLWGDAGEDSLYGGDGNDVLHVDADDKIYDGGDGYDTLVADGSTGITVDLGENNIERAYGGANSDNIYTSTSASVYIDGGAGTDALTGNDGDDTLIGGAGNDAFHGGDGDDTLYVDSEDTIIDAGEGTDTLIVTGDSGLDIDLSAANVEIAVGGNHADTFRISGAESIVADLGDGDDLVLSGSGRDVLSGGDGEDTVSYELSDTKVYASLAVGFAGVDGYAEADSLDGFENIIGSSHDDVLTGDDLINKLVGGAGNDNLIGGGGDDILTGGIGDDVIEGGEGDDVAVFSGKFSDYTVTKTEDRAASVVWNGASGTDSGSDTVSEVETLQFDDAVIYLDGRNNRPYTQADTASTREDTAVIISKEDVFANDIDFDGDPMHISNVSAAVNGSVSLTSGGDIRFVPSHNYYGEASFTYTACDDKGLEHSSTVSVTVEAVNDAPTIQAGGAQYSGQHSPYSGSGRVLGTDVDDSSLTYQLVSGDGFSVSSDGSFSYDGGNQTDSMVVRITDPHGASSTHTISITNPEKPDGGGKKPIAMDLDNDGLEFIGIDDSDVYMDVNNDEFIEHLAWVSGDDGLLAFDRNDDGKIEGFDEISFAADHDDARTDLEGLALGYDSNSDGEFNAEDDLWDRFGIWQDANENGICEHGEFIDLEIIGVSSIGLSSDWQAERLGDTVLFGKTSFETTDGEVGILGDVAFLYDDSRYVRIDNDDGSSRIVQVAEDTEEGRQVLNEMVDEVIADIQEQNSTTEQQEVTEESVESDVSPEDMWLQDQQDSDTPGLEDGPEESFNHDVSPEDAWLQEQQGSDIQGLDDPPAESINGDVSSGDAWLQEQAVESFDNDEQPYENNSESISDSRSDSGIGDGGSVATEACQVAEAMAVFDSPDDSSAEIDSAIIDLNMDVYIDEAIDADAR
ncbi:Ig-like domain-containing protein [Maridesulfovibrio sp.]|uniref:Ig-like domain-containing protein n=1 Tax=Maridesulfovibrio sp. TaxID=2795000 RepID=UPI002A18D8D9|nr:cadherin-like domain-containing protein [Maridesulfovibrio sp.]